MQTIDNTYTNWRSAAGRLVAVPIRDLILSGIPMEDESAEDYDGDTNKGMLELETDELVDADGQIGIHNITAVRDRIDDIMVDVGTEDEPFRIGIDYYGDVEPLFCSVHYEPGRDDPRVMVRYWPNGEIAEVEVTDGVPVVSGYEQGGTPWLRRRDGGGPL